MVAFLALVTLAWQAGAGKTNKIPEPAFGLFVAGAIFGLYAMVSPLLHWPPYRAKADRRNSRLASRKKARLTQEETAVIPSTRTSAPPAPPASSPIPTALPSSGLRQSLQLEFENGQELLRRLPSNFGLGQMLIQQLNGQPLATDLDVTAWERGVQDLLVGHPKLLAHFSDKEPSVVPLGTKFLETPLQRKLTRRMARLEVVIKNL